LISLFKATNTNFDGNGDVILQPLTCSHDQVAAGKYDLTIKHPIDKAGKWMEILPEAIIRAPVPPEKIENAYSGLDVDVYRTTEEAALRDEPSEPELITYQTWVAGGNYTVGSRVTCPGQSHRNYQCSQWDAESGQVMVPPYNSDWWYQIADRTSGSPALMTLKTGTRLYYISGPSNGWYKMSTTYGIEGYIKASQVTFVEHMTPEQTQPHTIRTQLFRIRSISIDSKNMQLNATAEHVSYDLGAIMVANAKIHQQRPATALAMIEQEFMMDYQGTIATNLTKTTDGTYTGEIKGKNAIYALLDPDKGIVSTFDAAYRRDNWDVFVMRKTNTDRGFRLRYRKNMLGVNWNIKTENLVTRVVPVAKAEDGSDLFLYPTKWVDSAHISEYPVIRMEWLKVSGQVGKDDGTESGNTWTEASLRAEMRKKAEERFNTDKVDVIVHEITVDFEMLGDTAEYKTLKDLENVLMYDQVTVINEEIQLSIQAEVCEIEYDCIRERVRSIKLTNVTKYSNRTVSGYNVFTNSITGDKLTDDAADGIARPIKDDAVKESNNYTDSKVSSLRSWVNRNFEPKAE